MHKPRKSIQFIGYDAKIQEGRWKLLGRFGSLEEARGARPKKSRSPMKFTPRYSRA